MYEVRVQEFVVTEVCHELPDFPGCGLGDQHVLLQYQDIYSKFRSRKVSSQFPLYKFSDSTNLSCPVNCGEEESDHHHDHQALYSGPEHCLDLTDQTSAQFVWWTLCFHCGPALIIDQNQLITV